MQDDLAAPADKPPPEPPTVGPREITVFRKSIGGSNFEFSAVPQILPANVPEPPKELASSVPESVTLSTSQVQTEADSKKSEETNASVVKVNDHDESAKPSSSSKT